jgi:hypothetical protein
MRSRPQTSALLAQLCSFFFLNNLSVIPRSLFPLLLLRARDGTACLLLERTLSSISGCFFALRVLLLVPVLLPCRPLPSLSKTLTLCWTWSLPRPALSRLARVVLHRFELRRPPPRRLLPVSPLRLLLLAPLYLAEPGGFKVKGTRVLGN